MNKKCKRCGTSYRTASGDCRECNRLRKKKWRTLNPGKEKTYPEKKEDSEKSAKRQRKWRGANRQRARSIAHKRRTRKTKAGGSYTAEEFKSMCAHYDYRCLACGKKFPLSKLTFDHIIPVIKGGTSDIGNGQPLCRSCNSSKGTKTTDYRKGNVFTRWIQRKLF